MGSPGSSTRRKPSDCFASPGSIMMMALKNRICSKIIKRGISEEN
jgi:hypothetical protein